jgi:phosphoglycolate phosphatase
MVGDSINDIEGARRAGMRGIAAAYGYTQMPVEDFKADAVISSLIELPKAIQKLPQDATLSS